MPSYDTGNIEEIVVYGQDLSGMFGWDFGNFGESRGSALGGPSAVSFERAHEAESIDANGLIADLIADGIVLEGTLTGNTQSDSLLSDAARKAYQTLRFLSDPLGGLADALVGQDRTDSGGDITFSGSVGDAYDPFAGTALDGGILDFDFNQPFYGPDYDVYTGEGPGAVDPDFLTPPLEPVVPSFEDITYNYAPPVDTAPGATTSGGSPEAPFIEPPVITPPGVTDVTPSGPRFPISDMFFDRPVEGYFLNPEARTAILENRVGPAVPQRRLTPGSIS